MFGTVMSPIIFEEGTVVQKIVLRSWCCITKLLVQDSPYLTYVVFKMERPGVVIGIMKAPLMTYSVNHN